MKNLWHVNQTCTTDGKEEMDNKWTEADEVETPGQNNSWDMRGSGWGTNGKTDKLRKEWLMAQRTTGTDQIKTHVA